MTTTAPGTSDAPCRRPATAPVRSTGTHRGHGGIRAVRRTRACRRTCTAWPTSTAKAAKRAERQVATLFVHLDRSRTVAVHRRLLRDPQRHAVFVPGIGSVSAAEPRPRPRPSALSLFCIGVGAVHWAKTLMPDEEVVEERHPHARSRRGPRRRRRRRLARAARQSGFGRRPLIKYTLGRRARRCSPLPAGPAAVGDLGPLPGDELSTHHVDARALRLVARPGAARRSRPPTSPSARSSTSCPRASTSAERRARAEGQGRRAARCASTPSDIKVAKERDWGYQGIVAYSKICTHVGCPVGLYEQQTHHLLCPCHQSTFDVTDDCKVIFGPAERPLPQLPITVDAEGYLVAQQRLRRARRPELLGASDEHHNRPTRPSLRADDAKPPAGAAQSPTGVDEPARRSHRRRQGRYLRKIFPDHWSFMLGEIALYSFIVLLLTGHVPDVLFFQPSMTEVVYHGSYVPLNGITMSEAYRSTLRHLLRRPRRPAHPADPPLGRAALRRRDHRAHVPGVLHRRVPQAARAQLGDRRRPARCWRMRRGLRRLLAARRPALRHRPAHRRRASCGRSRWSARTCRSSSSAASSRATASSRGSTPSTSCCCPAIIARPVHRAT